MPPKAHARLGGSGSKRWMTCPGSVLLSEGIPDSTSSYAEEGTRAHDLAENILCGNEPDLSKYPEEMVEAVTIYVDFIDSLEAPEEYVEHQFDLAPLNPPDPIFGTCDYVGWWPEERVLHVADYKHGRGVAVEVADNPQCLTYALGAVVEIGKKPLRVLTSIVQPRADHPDGPLRTVEYTWDDMVTFKKELFAAAEAAILPGAELVVGDHCRFCKAKAVCPAQREFAMVTAQSEFDVEDEVVLQDPRTLTNDQLGAIMDRSDMVTSWLKEVQAYALAQLDQGATVPGWKVVAKRAMRKWVNEEAVLAFFTRRRTAKRDYEIRKPCSPAQAEKIFKGDKNIMRGLTKLWEKKSSGNTLAPADDPRPAITAGEEFDTDG